MKWYERLYKTRARKYLLIGLLSLVLPVGTAVTVGGGIDGAIDQVFQQEESAGE